MSTHPDNNAAAEVEQHASNLLEAGSILKEKAKLKAKRIFKRDQTSDDESVFSDPAFDPAKVLDNKSDRLDKSVRETLKDGAKDLKFVVAHPRRVARGKAIHKTAGTIGETQHPALTAERDQELLDAHDALAQAESDIGPGPNHQADIDDARHRIQVVEEKKEDLQTAWILGRHVSRVKVVRPVMVDRPKRSQYTTITPTGERRLQWERYVGHLALYYTRGFNAPYIDDFETPPFDLEDLARILERIAITSAPLQTFFMKIREVYMWKDPKCTAKWAALFAVLWYFQYIMSYVYFYILYSTLRNKFNPGSVKAVRASVARSFDREKRVQAWGELLQRHGQNNWIEPLLDEVGPILQMQLGDIADLLEVLINFHRNEKPGRTLASLFFFGSCLTITLSADMAFCMKLVWFIVGAGFFVTFPIATNFPKYRYLVSHMRWMFWDIPTHSELAILRLQEKAIMRDADLSEFELHAASEPLHTFSVKEETDGKGQLEVGRSGLTLTTKISERTWVYSELVELQKLDAVESDTGLNKIKNLHSSSSAVLQILLFDKTLTLILEPAHRDRAFNLILAWSGQKWQSLRMEGHNKGKDDKSNLDRAMKRAFR
ncbi:hypothetical protein EDD37DRAFT_305567 [Exophiala viscosa]|uniref:uncharacterized protein n=1 Tax=Exophiala viscosa TaxID=2486360 RepID=UPI002193BA66|nr:hypothetical protein EDD37DRAFT_305567 [Exophiala viscosa]